MPRTSKSVQEEAVEDGPQMVAMDLDDHPSRTSQRHGYSQRIAAMKPDRRQALFFPLPEGRTTTSFRSSISAACSYVQKSNPGRKFETRLVKQGVVDGVAVWRVD